MVIAFGKPSFLGLIILCYILSYFIREVFIHQLTLTLRLNNYNAYWLTLEVICISELLIAGVLYIIEYVMNKSTKSQSQNQNKEEPLNKEESNLHTLLQTLNLINCQSPLLVFNTNCNKCCSETFIYLKTLCIVTFIFVADFLPKFILGLQKHIQTQSEVELYSFACTLFIFILNFIISGCSIIINLKYYLHHLIAIGTFFLGYLLMNIPIINYGIETFWYLMLIYSFAFGLINSVSETQFKSMMIDRLLNPKKLLCLKSLIESVLLFGFLACFQKEFNEINASYSNVFQSGACVVFFFGIVIFSMITGVGFVCILQIYNPLSRIMACVNANILIWIYYRSINGIPNMYDAKYIVVGVIGMVLELAGVLVYYEIIVLKFFGLDKKTKRNMEAKDNNEVVVPMNEHH